MMETETTDEVVVAPAVEAEAADATEENAAEPAPEAEEVAA